MSSFQPRVKGKGEGDKEKNRRVVRYMNEPTKYWEDIDRLLS